MFDIKTDGSMMSWIYSEILVLDFVFKLAMTSPSVLTSLFSDLSSIKEGFSSRRCQIFLQ